MPTAAFLGNCQAQSLRNVFAQELAGDLGLEAVWINAFAGGAPLAALEKLRTADLVVIQVNDGYRPGVLDAIESAIRPGTKRILFPDVRGNYYWPYGGVHRVDNPTPDYAKAGPYNPEVGDVYLNRLIRQGMSADDALADYSDHDIPRKRGLDRLVELILHSQRKRDTASDFGIADHIESNFRTERLFITPGHLGLSLFCVVASQVYGAMGVPAHMVDRALGRIRLYPFAPYHEAPIHPSVIAYLGLRFADENTLW